ncbi:MAG TPA: hypothetical protein VNT03_22485 [Baekduia sp.]|nr:hypothetical protein [Baekduia sp.]
MSAEVLERLADLARADDGLLAAAVRDDLPRSAPLGDDIAGSPRAAGHQADLALVVEAVREGYLLHHGDARVIDDADPDLALLAGDRLYAAGLERLAVAGDLASVRALADVIALSAGAHAAGNTALADAVWDAGCAEIGWGSSEALEAAKIAAQTGDAGAAESLVAAARQARGTT